MKALVIGYGSIGKRHLNNLLKLRHVDEITVCSSHLDSFQDHRKESRLKLIHSLEDVSPVDGSGRHIDFAVIANETYAHIETAKRLANSHVHLFIEKPLSHSLHDALSLREIVAQQQIKAFVAYNFRFLGALHCIKDQLNSGSIGNPLFAAIEVGQYLPSWRPSSDYRQGYSARKDKGGGVALDLSHEIDYMRFLFNDPLSWKTMKSKASDLEIDSEDIFSGIYRFENGFLCTLHMDYIRHNKKRTISIVGSEGSLECDFVNKYIKVQRNNGESSMIEDPNLFDIDESYRSELDSFIGCIENDEVPQITIDDGIAVLRLIEDGHV